MASKALFPKTIVKDRRRCLSVNRQTSGRWWVRSCLNRPGYPCDEHRKIITLGEGDRELEMLRIIQASGYLGPIGIIGHTEGKDIRAVLEGNLEGLEVLKGQL